jgi:phosphoesterase RecJ-like protein
MAISTGGSPERIQWAEATQAVNSAASILLVAHVNPDGDAVGSLVGLGLALREQGKLVTMALDDGVPDYLHLLPGAETVVRRLDSGHWDLLIALDSSDEQRIGLAGAYGRAHSRITINLDHHPTNTYFGDYFLVIPTAVSSTEIVFDWLNHMAHPLSRAVATALLTGLVTDTVGFRISSVTPRTLEIVQRLMQAGAQLHDIMMQTLDNKSYATVSMWKYALATMQLKDGVIWVSITQDSLRQSGADTNSDNGGLVNLLVNVDEAAVAAVFTELADGHIKMSFRCKPGYDVSQVAFSLGGGGHKQAAGATLPGALVEVQARVLPLLYDAARQKSTALP